MEATKSDSGFEIRTESDQFSSKKIILATGFPKHKRLKKMLGISVIYCPYCHGYEFKNQKTGIMTDGETAFHIAGLVKNLTSDVSIFTNGKADFSMDQLSKL